ncbi:ABC transporter G family member 7-like protein [Drosera capensis]
MERLRRLAEDGHTVICSIHQPRSSIYYIFDDIILLSKGSPVYAGPAKDEPLIYFAKFGYLCPDHVNPAEFLADLISVDYTSTDSVYSSQKRIDGDWLLLPRIVDMVLVDLSILFCMCSLIIMTFDLLLQSYLDQFSGEWEDLRLLSRTEWDSCRADSGCSIYFNKGEKSYTDDICVSDSSVMCSLF